MTALNPTYAEEERALSSINILHSCHPESDTYKQKYKISIPYQGIVSLRNQFRGRIISSREISS
jgi:hypothetical protein